MNPILTIQYNVLLQNYTFDYNITMNCKLQYNANTIQYNANTIQYNLTIKLQ